MATQQAWNDFAAFLEVFLRCKREALNLKAALDQLQALKEDILGDVDRRNAIKPIIDEHPDYEYATIPNDSDKWLTLRQGLIDGEYV